MNNYKPVIGLEIHVELKTKSKMFCQCSADYFGKVPNTNTCPVCLGLPGALPVPNKKAVEWAVLIGKSLSCSIANLSKFDRKNYFYPDLPKGYQISQYDEPIAKGGIFEIRGEKFEVKKKIGITRVHLEEDTGKLIHENGYSSVDFNRSGVPLVEIVTEPDFDNGTDVVDFLHELHTIIRYLDVSDADMEKGSMRMEPNISVRKITNNKSQIANEPQNTNDQLPNYKVEVKNINSFRFVKQAIEYEIERHIELLEKGETPKQETRGFDEKKAETYSQRSKEEAHDYRYFPEPDIPPMTFSKSYIDSVKVPSLPSEKMADLITELKLKPQDAFILTRDRKTVQFFEEVVSNIRSSISGHDKKIDESVLPQNVANIIINKKLQSDLSVEEFAKKAAELIGPKATDEKLLDASIKHLIEANQKVVADYKNGKQNALMFLVGAVMREMKGKADAKIVIRELKKKLG